MPIIELSRPLVYGKRGMVCSDSALAAAAGIHVLQEGGNAFDAALAVAAVETVTLVPLCGLGGDSFILLHEANTGRITGVNSSGVAGSGATADFYRSQGYQTMPLTGPHSASVPGEVAAWGEVHRRFCTMSLAALLDRAVGYAEEGFPISPGTGQELAGSVGKLAQFPSTASLLLRDGRPPNCGDVLLNKDLAASLRRVVQGGPEEFYQGGLAREMVAALRSAGGPFTEKDFAAHQAEVYQPIATTYRGHTIYQTRPPSQGFLLLEMLNMVEGFDLAALGCCTSQAIHTMVEAKKIAYADRNRLAGDPWFVDWPLDEITSKEYAGRRRVEIDPARAALETVHPQPVPADGDTTYFCVADAAGNAVSWVHSLSDSLGSGFIADGTGILFNNRAGRGFSLVPGHPNMIEPGKRTMHTLTCFLTTKEGLPEIIGGTPGGDFQPQCGLQVLTNLLDFKLDPQQAVEAPRWWSFPGTDPATLETAMEVRVEPGMSEETVRGLESLGHRVARRPPGAYDGNVQLIVYDHQRGVLMGASDPRGDGQAAAW